MGNAPQIETKRLLLTWPNANQIEKYYESIIGTEIFDTILWDGPTGPEDLHEYWEEVYNIDPSNAEENLHLAVIEKTSNLCIGGLSLRPVSKDPTNANIGYAFAPQFHGKGYATEAVRALVDEAFLHRKGQRVYADIFVGNQPSRRVLEKIGFQFEGIRKQAVLKRGKWLDEWLMAITRPEWERLRSKK